MSHQRPLWVVGVCPVCGGRRLERIVSLPARTRTWRCVCGWSMVRRYQTRGC